jgi:hypothetical protein
MCSAFWKGIELLSRQGSDSVQSPGEMIEGDSTSKQIKGISRVPKNVTRLKPVVNKLIRKVIIIGT